MFKNRSFLVKMVNDKNAPEGEPVEEEIDLDAIRGHFRKYKYTYLAAGVAGITWVVMRSMSLPNIKGADGVLAQGADGVLGENSVRIHAPSFFSNYKPTISTIIEANRQGPPSWVVRCKETGEIFTSQKSAAAEMGLSASHISEHLNGGMEHVKGLHFERICMAA